MEPHGDELRSDPELPREIDRLVLRRVPGRWGTGDVTCGAVRES
jgi:hypothetical protein